MSRTSKVLCILSVTALIGVAADMTMTMTVEQLTSFIKSSVQKHFPDRQVADYLKHVKLSNKLDDRTIEDLQGMGAGPKTVAAMRELGEKSASLAPPPPPPAPHEYKQPPPPDSIEQAKILDAARDYALNYDRSLPNFICAEVVRRYVDPYHTGPRSLLDPDWRLADTITSKLTYFDHEEKYEVQMVNNTSVVNKGYDSVGGAVSRGEFGSMMREIFDKTSEARFGWDKWTTLRGRLTYVFAFDIAQPNSKYTIDWERSNLIRPALRGKIYVDKDTDMITRIMETPYDIPAAYPVQAVTTILDFDFVKIGDSEYLVPLKSVTTAATVKYLSRNEKEFRLYQRFGAATSIKFADVTNNPLPADKTEETPVGAPATQTPQKPPQ
jgi:hypothetical protein